MDIDIIYKDVQVNEIAVKPAGNHFSAVVNFSSARGDFTINLNGIRDPDNLTDLLYAKRIWLKEETDSQIEFGRYILGIQDESYSEIIFDDYF